MLKQYIIENNKSPWPLQVYLVVNRESKQLCGLKKRIFHI